MMRACLVLAICLTACLRTTSFHCETNEQCGSSGVCESTGYCSLPDDQCGRRYSSGAGSLAGKCVGGEATDAAIDSPSIDGLTDSNGSNGSDCPSDYVAVSGQAHKYRLVTGGEAWTTAQTSCAASAPTAYLAIPDDATELAALDTLAGTTATYWIGVTDTAAPGTWVTAKSAPQTFLPWAPGSPRPVNNADDCVRVIKANQPAKQFQDDKCATAFAVICECE
jgi:hypothetical protein